MNERFEYLDPVFKSRQTRYPWLSLHYNESAILRIFRALSGTCSIRDCFSRGRWTTDTNYFVFPYTRVDRKNSSQISNLFPEEMGLKEISDSFKKLRRNKDFFELIEPEVVNCLVARRSGRTLESFLFLYRCLEGISYSVPLIYISRKNSFNGSYKALQKYMPSKDNEGELVLFKRFLREAFSNNFVFQSSIDISLDELGVEDLKANYYAYYKSLVKGEPVDDVEDEYISLGFVQFFEFLIEIRNRYFHFLQGTWKENIRTKNIIHPDLFFTPIIDNGINWLSLIFFEVLMFEIDSQK